MWLAALISLSISQVPDGGTWSVSRTVEVTKVVPKREDAVSITLQTVTFSTTQAQERSFTTATVRLPNGRVTPALKELNAKLATLPDLDEVQRALRAGEWSGDTGRSIDFVINRRPFIDVRICDDVMGSYPSTSCAHVRLDVNTGLEWTWTDAILPARRPAFFTECSKRIAKLSRDQEDAWISEEVEALEYLRDSGFLPTECTSVMFDEAEFGPDDLSLTMWNGRGAGHAVQALMWPLSFSRAELVKWVDPQGPLGHLVEKK